jgi:hypothetical protein
MGVERVIEWLWPLGVAVTEGFSTLVVEFSSFVDDGSVLIVKHPFQPDSTIAHNATVHPLPVHHSVPCRSIMCDGKRTSE